MQCDYFCLYYQEIVFKKRFLYSNVYINTIDAKKFCLSYKFKNKKWHEIWNIQIVSEKPFCHSQISMIFIQNILGNFYFISNFLSNLRTEMVL